MVRMVRINNVHHANRTNIQRIRDRQGAGWMCSAREAIHKRLPVDELIKLEVLSMADALIAAAKREPHRQRAAA